MEVYRLLVPALNTCKRRGVERSVHLKSSLVSVPHLTFEVVIAPLHSLLFQPWRLGQCVPPK
jgi:hypothetical protein